jgi:hypothetical protein
MGHALRFDLRKHNAVLVGHDRYFILRSDDQAHLVRDSCPHRAGPLSMARLTPDGRRLTCPWHGTRVGVAALRRTAVAMVRSGDTATVVLANIDDNAPIRVVRRRIAANLPPVDRDDEARAPGRAEEG